MNMQIWLIVDVVVGWFSSMFLFWYGLNHANGKKKLRLFAAIIVLYWTIVYTVTLFGVLTLPNLSFALRPVVSLLFILPVLDSIADGFHGRGRQI